MSGRAGSCSSRLWRNCPGSFDRTVWLKEGEDVPHPGRFLGSNSLTAFHGRMRMGGWCGAFCKTKPRFTTGEVGPGRTSECDFYFGYHHCGLGPGHIYTLLEGG